LPPAVKAMLDEAVARHRAGDLARAEALYQEVARQAPRRPDVHHLLGLALHQQGRNIEARRAIEAAIGLFDGSPHYHNNLGEVLRSSGEAEAAIACYRRALALAPEDLQAANNLALALHASGRLDEALAQFARLARRAPDAPEVHNNLGVAQQASGELDAAVESFRRVTTLAPRHAEAWNNLGAALQSRGDLEGAREALERAVALAPAAARAHYNLSRVRAALGAWEDAENSARRAVELAPGEADLHLQLGYVLRARDRPGESVSAVRAALALAPDHPVANNDLGVALMMEGDFAAAERHLRAALEAAPRLTIAFENLARVRRFGDDDAALMERMAALLEDPGLDDARRTHLHFALGKMWDDRGDAGRAIRHLQAGNALLHAVSPWDAEARSRRVDRIMEVFDAGWLSAQAGRGHPTAAPVFVIGMLRSGTTLVEQILASHPRVLARGELEFFDEVARIMPARVGMPDTPYPECARGLAGDDLAALARRYLSEVFAEPGDAERFTDKNPLNFDHLGIIAAAFPNASIVHVSRDPMDTGFSIYATHFARSLPFSNDLVDIGRYHRDYQRLMDHWRGLLGGRIHELRYEDLLEDQEGCTRALLAACGLEFDPACLAFHQTRRSVGTASHWQVRQPLYAGARGRAARYADWLEPLRAALGA
jgi:Flp pilus assembly protein TadD